MALSVKQVKRDLSNAIRGKSLNSGDVTSQNEMYFQGMFLFSILVNKYKHLAYKYKIGNNKFIVGILLRNKVFYYTLDIKYYDYFNCKVTEPLEDEYQEEDISLLLQLK